VQGPGPRLKPDLLSPAYGAPEGALIQSYRFSKAVKATPLIPINGASQAVKAN